MGLLEPVAGLEPVNLLLTRELLYQLSYTGTIKEPPFWQLLF